MGRRRPSSPAITSPRTRASTRTPGSTSPSSRAARTSTPSRCWPAAAPTWWSTGCPRRWRRARRARRSSTSPSRSSARAWNSPAGPIPASRRPKDLPDHTLGVWFYGNEYPFLAWMAKLGIKTDGSAGGVKVLKQGFNVDPLLQKQAACISTMTYNEYWQVIEAGMKPDATRRVQLYRPGRRHDGGRPLRARRQAQGPGLRRQDGPLRRRPR